ncbi:hypothetical protein QMA51_00225 [Leuconostoc suionicum]|uniref:hypothetical protein n=1 Tax=Leuconostoc suionicum TaxID=1511761 RepID=UPI0024ACA370|nr:hypothetical protein [Leuconostoc suionicum]MDI6550078.1 hypothetical protein [Leuconostoc suionicum]
MNWVILVIMLVLVAYIFWQRHQMYRFREAGRFNSYYAKHLRALADHEKIEVQRAKLCLRTVGYDMDKVASGDLTFQKPTQQEMDDIMKEHYALQSKSKQIDARLEVETAQYEGEFDNYGG